MKNLLLQDETISKNIENTIEVTYNAFKNGNKLILCGNGGSTCDAMHIAEELTGKYNLERPPLPAIALNDPAHITCTANDYGFEAIFERGIQAYGKAGDILYAFSTSGNSNNVIKAAKMAKSLNMTCIAFTGKYDGNLSDICDIVLNVPSEKTSHIQECHITLGHLIIESIENKMFG